MAPKLRPRRKASSSDSPEADYVDNKAAGRSKANTGRSGRAWTTTDGEDAGTGHEDKGVGDAEVEGAAGQEHQDPQHQQRPPMCYYIAIGVALSLFLAVLWLAYRLGCDDGYAKAISHRYGPRYPNVPLFRVPA